MTTQKVKINTERVRFQTAPELYGLFFEDINHAADGGLYPEALRNRAFEDGLVPEGCRVDPERKIYTNEGGWPGVFNHGEGMDEWAASVPFTEVPAWYGSGVSLKVSEDRGEVLNRNRRACLKTIFSEGGVLSNIGFSGISAVQGGKYRLLLFLKADREVVFRAELRREGLTAAETVIPVEASEEYRRYEAVLTARETDHQLTFSLTSDRECRVCFGFTSLLPEDTFMGHGLRRDLCEMLKNTHASFIRFPGGCVVEGINEENTLRFSKTIGPVWERPSSQLMWHYRATNGLGFHEYLQLCEDLEMEAMYVLNCGMSCQARHGHGFSEEKTEEYLEEAFHALEYALSGPETEYGARRAAAGHPKPFRLKYVEIGNENYGAEYEERYHLFYQTLKEHFPEVIYIANCHVEKSGEKTEIVDEHYYNSPEFFMENIHMFDSYDREGPKIFLGEYAVNGGHTVASMECALAEAAWMTGAEENQDVIRLSAYAPLFQNADYTAWFPNLIVFNNHEVYGIPSYHALSLFGKYRGSEVYETLNQTMPVYPRYKGGPGLMAGREGLTFRNPRINGKPAGILKQVYGEITSEGEESRLIFSEKNQHHYTGKNDTWNRAFEKFIADGDFRGEPVIMTLFEDPGLSEYVFEIDLKFDNSVPVTLSVLNDNVMTEAGCNEPRDYDWNRFSIRNQVWHLENGRSMLRMPPQFYEAPLSADEFSELTADAERFHTYRMEVRTDGYTCSVDGKIIAEKQFTPYSSISCSASGNGNEIYLKLVSAESEAIPLRIELDTEVREAYVEVLEGAPELRNSFAEKEKVHVRTGKLELSCGQPEYVVPPHSVNVLVLKK